jgi:hypothetical protein
MGKMATTLDGKLPEFQKYLLEKNLTPAKNLPFYAHWVSRFLIMREEMIFSFGISGVCGFRLFGILEIG